MLWNWVDFFLQSVANVSRMTFFTSAATIVASPAATLASVTYTAASLLATAASSAALCDSAHFCLRQRWEGPGCRCWQGRVCPAPTSNMFKSLHSMSNLLLHPSTCCLNCCGVAKSPSALSSLSPGYLSFLAIVCRDILASMVLVVAVSVFSMRPALPRSDTIEGR